MSPTPAHHSLLALVRDEPGDDVPDLFETLADRSYAQSIDLDGVPRLRVGGTIVPAWLALGEARNAFEQTLGAVS